jgi:site-specific recombinase XerD
LGQLLYGAGLRVMECVRLRVKDVDFGYDQIVVRDGKGNKDRVTMLPAIIGQGLQRHLQAESPKPAAAIVFAIMRSSRLCRVNLFIPAFSILISDYYTHISPLIARHNFALFSFLLSKVKSTNRVRRKNAKTIILRIGFKTDAYRTFGTLP